MIDLGGILFTPSWEEISKPTKHLSEEREIRYMLKFFGIYRTQGDKPLIHKGKKP